MHLEIFETELLRHLAPIDIVHTLFSQASCLRAVKELGLSNFHEDTSDTVRRSTCTMRETGRYWSLVLDQFTSMIPSVEEVQLDVPLHVECCAYFGSMTKLKMLNWDGSAYSYSAEEPS